MNELFGIAIPLRDGTRLFADVFLPESGERCPVILEITPYGRGPDALSFRYEAPDWVTRGYVFAIVDARGQGDSEGEFGYLQQEAEDGYDVVEWLALQPWCNARVGMRGSSYSGTNQWYVARLHPPHLRCITPNCAAAAPFDDLPYPSGVFMSGWALRWLSALPRAGVEQRAIDWAGLLLHRPLATADVAAFGAPVPLYRRFAEHSSPDDYWRPLDFSAADYAAIDIPSLAFSGWFDGTLAGTVARYRGVSAMHPHDHWLIVGPWIHMNAPDGGLDYQSGEPSRLVGNLELPEHASLRGRSIVERFFDRYLRDGPAFDEPAVRLFVTGANRWLESAAYPPFPTAPRRFHLHSDGQPNSLAGDGRLDEAPPGLNAPSAHYRSDPCRPIGSMPPGSDVVTLSGSPIDLAPLIDRADVLVYLSEAMNEPLVVVGRVLLVLHAATDGLDTDFMAQLEDVAPTGIGTKLGSHNGAVLRARYRHRTAEPVLLEPDMATRFELDFLDIGHAFMPGHRIRLSVMSTSYPFTFPNPNTGLPISSDMSPPRVARQTVFHDRLRPSHLLLPTLAETSAP